MVSAQTTTLMPDGQTCAQCRNTLQHPTAWCPYCGRQFVTAAKPEAAKPEVPKEMKAAATVSPPASVPPVSGPAPAARPAQAKSSTATGPPLARQKASKIPSYAWLLIFIVLSGMVISVLIGSGARHRSTQSVSSEPVADTLTLYAVRNDAGVHTENNGTSPSYGRHLSRGDEVHGRWMDANANGYRWLLMTDGPYKDNYVWDRNLSTERPPDLVLVVEGNKPITQDSTVYEQPDENSRQLDQLTAGTSAYVAGFLANSWAEIHRVKGGVAYIPPQATQQPQPVDTTTVPSTQVDFAALQQLVLAQLRRYWALWSSSNDEMLTSVAGYYADPVMYFGSSMSRAQVVQQKSDFSLRWPERSYTMEESSLRTDCNAEGTICTANGIVDWRAYSPERQAGATGAATFTFVFSINNSEALITSENSSVISRRRL